MDDIIDTLEAIESLRVGLASCLDNERHPEQGNRKYCPAIYVMNKIDQITIEELDIIAEVAQKQSA